MTPIRSRGRHNPAAEVATAWPGERSVGSRSRPLQGTTFRIWKDRGKILDVRGIGGTETLCEDTKS